LLFSCNATRYNRAEATLVIRAGAVIKAIYHINANFIITHLQTQ